MVVEGLEDVEGVVVVVVVVEVLVGVVVRWSRSGGG